MTGPVIVPRFSGDGWSQRPALTSLSSFRPADPCWLLAPGPTAPYSVVLAQQPSQTQGPGGLQHLVLALGCLGSVSEWELRLALGAPAPSPNDGLITLGADLSGHALSAPSSAPFLVPPGDLRVVRPSAIPVGPLQSFSGFLKAWGGRGSNLGATPTASHCHLASS